MIKHLSKDSQGYVVLITVLVLGVVVSTIGAFLLLSGASASVSSQAVKGGIEAKAAATGCAELALGAIQANPTISTPATGSSTLNAVTQETCSYTISGISPSYTILAVGQVNAGPTFVHRLGITTTQTTPTITVSSWQDTP